MQSITVVHVYVWEVHAMISCYTPCYDFIFSLWKCHCLLMLKGCIAAISLITFHIEIIRWIFPLALSLKKDIYMRSCKLLIHFLLFTELCIRSHVTIAFKCFSNVIAVVQYVLCFFNDKFSKSWFFIQAHNLYNLHLSLISTCVKVLPVHYPTYR